MSNYYCPRCGKAIIDNGRDRRDEIHTCTPFEKELIDGAKRVSKIPISSFINI